MKAWQIVSNDGIDSLKLADIPEPKPGPGEVLVRVRASSINYRDLSTVENPGPRGLPHGRVPNSDGAGEVVEVGPGVTRAKAGDRVAGTFFETWTDGRITARDMARARGGTADGLLAEYRVLNEDGLVHIPAHMSYEEAATLPCAAVTAWHSLVEAGGVKRGETVLLLGTGGVSVVALQLAGILGARAIVTSSSDEKLARAKVLGAWETVNYKAVPDWETRVLELTGGEGVDHTVEVGGPGTLTRSLAATRIGGSVGMIGVLTGGGAETALINRRSIKVQGIYVGSRRMFEDMNRAMAAAAMKPVVDRSFPMAEARAAYHAMRAAGHFGKLVVSI